MPSKKSSTRLSAEKRRASIISAALKVFSERGFHGTTTKALAKEAGISEALLFRHFPSKENLYEALQQECCTLKKNPDSERVMNLDPSTSTLIVIIHFMMAKLLCPPSTPPSFEQRLHRMLAHSYNEDGVFARLFMHSVSDGIIVKIEASLKAAMKSGDIVQTPLKPNLRAWFAQHFGAALMLNLLPGVPIVDFKAPDSEVVAQATWFALLGMGLKAEAISSHYNPKAFTLLGSQALF